MENALVRTEKMMKNKLKNEARLSF